MHKYIKSRASANLRKIKNRQYQPQLERFFAVKPRLAAALIQLNDITLKKNDDKYGIMVINHSYP
jgi:hypothetical protein